MVHKLHDCWIIFYRTSPRSCFVAMRTNL